MEITNKSSNKGDDDHALRLKSKYVRKYSTIVIA